MSPGCSFRKDFKGSIKGVKALHGMSLQLEDWNVLRNKRLISSRVTKQKGVAVLSSNTLQGWIMGAHIARKSPYIPCLGLAKVTMSTPRANQSWNHLK